MTTAYGTERETKIKICGLRRLEDAQIVNAVQAQYGGFVFAKSKRQVTMAQAQQLREVLLPSVQTVGVFVDAAPAEIAALCQQGIIDIVQFHGHEDAAYIQQLRALIQAPIVKAVQVRSAEVVLQAQQLDCDYLLLDTYIPGVAGGSGQQFDYQQIPPLFLSGRRFNAGECTAGHSESTSLCSRCQQRRRRKWLEKRRENKTVCTNGAQHVK